ncbi:hypothetical protein EHS25_006360 [Saitozyma podzolica]|uniref:Major facilitator superfamily (MFS) profile domain-containing protein n=1 Tax=Saitozyma podzolica TaxID=1890683 RepID=A0A427YRG3_9TREE|nr:hypothetical protein EHS25_006360 [Saitozyma podzolica]
MTDNQRSQTPSPDLDKAMVLHLEMQDIKVDEATAEYAAPTASHTQDEERAFVRRLDRRVLPWIMILYMLSYLDRSVLGNSVALGIKQDLHLVGSEYEWAGALFYCATFAFGTIGGLMLKVVKPRYYLAGCCIGWGGMAAAQAAATGFASLGAIRFLLGLFEASFAPGCAFYLSFWYTKDELTLRIAAYAGTSAISGVIGGLVSYAFGFASQNVLKQWQWLFIAEGIPTIIVGVLTPFILPDRPEQVKPRWMSDKEHAIALDRRNRYVKNASDEGINWNHVRAGFMDYRLWLFAVIYAGLSLSLAVISIFLPSLLSVMGFAGYKSNLMTVPPYAVGYFGLLLLSWVSGRIHQRGILISLAAAVGGVGYLLVGLVSGSAVRYFGAFLVVGGTYWSFPIVLAWIANTFATDSKAATGLGAVIAVTHAVGIAAAHIFPSNQAPQYRMGSIVSAALMLAAAVGAIVMSQLLQTENKRRDRLQRDETGPVALGAAADKDPNFRYVL